MVFTELINWLHQRLKKPLPGKEAQLKMSALARIRELIAVKDSDFPVQSGVLILLYPMDQDIGIVLMRRPDYKGVHGGQISLPGGKQELFDDDIVDTAIREAREEIGIDPVAIEILGNLTPLYIPPSNFMVTPVIGYQNFRPVFIPDINEVAEIIEIRLMDLLDDCNCKIMETKIHQGFVIKAPSYFINDNIIWGATAMILSELREIIIEFKMESASLQL